MAKETFLNRLFDAHTKDLNEVFPNQGDVFVCPICLCIFSRDAIYEKVLTDGHVWPKYFRDNSNKAKNMRVLLCCDCNHTAGSRGDKHMQIEEQIRTGELTGKWYGSRRIQFFKKPGDGVVNLNAKITGNMKELTISGRIDKNEKMIDSSPDDQARFHKIVEKGEPISILIHPYKNHDVEKVPQGWITSAYLMAFYALGYRYILHSTLDPVREYIKSTIYYDTSGQLIFPKVENFTIREYKAENYVDPELVFIIPLEHESLVYLQVNFIRYEIRLPFRYVQSVLEKSIQSQQHRISQLLSEKKAVALTVPVNCTKIEPHECFFDELLGKPLSNN